MLLIPGISAKTSVTDYGYCRDSSETASALPSYVSDIVSDWVIDPGVMVYFHVFISLDFHRFTIKSLVQFHTLQSLQHLIWSMLAKGLHRGGLPLSSCSAIHSSIGFGLFKKLHSNRNLWRHANSVGNSYYGYECIWKPGNRSSYDKYKRHSHQTKHPTGYQHAIAMNHIRNIINQRTVGLEDSYYGMHKVQGNRSLG